MAAFQGRVDGPAAVRCGTVPPWSATRSAMPARPKPRGRPAMPNFYRADL